MTLNSGTAAEGGSDFENECDGNMYLLNPVDLKTQAQPTTSPESQQSHASGIHLQQCIQIV